MSRLHYFKPLSPAPSSRLPSRRHRRRPDPWHRLARYTPALELGARLGANSLLALIAAVSLVRLVPHLKTQVQQLEVVQQELTQAEVVHTRLKSDFGRYFDPAQAGRVIQEQTGYRRDRSARWSGQTSGRSDGLVDGLRASPGEKIPI